MTNFIRSQRNIPTLMTLSYQFLIIIAVYTKLASCFMQNYYSGIKLHHHESLSALRSTNAPPVEAAVAVAYQNDAKGDASLNEKYSSSSNDIDAFEMIADLVATTLYQSDMKRDAKGKTTGTGSGSSATNWIDDKTSFALQQALNKIELKSPDERSGVDRDEALSWIRWMKTAPTPLVIDLTKDLTAASKNSISEKEFSQIDTTHDEFFNRLGCKLYIFPSGAELKRSLVESTGAIIFAKLLFGGVSRYRLLNSSNSKRAARRVGEHTAIKASLNDEVPCWIQFGGSERKYEAVDMGGAALLEITVLPKGQEMTSVLDQQHDGDMTLSKINWTPHQMFHFASNYEQIEDIQSVDSRGTIAMSLAGKERNDAFTNDFQSTVGGLTLQIESIVRRVLDGRVIRPVEEDGDDVDYTFLGESGKESSQATSQAALEADELALLGLTPVKGLLLYGPPGCGKTALAREISRALRARTPKIIAAPELLDRWVGSTEKMIRELFKDAEAELAACNGNPAKSALHVIVIDEIDAVFRRRSSSEDSGETTRASAVNQILAKLDGVDSIPNVLLIGMTNRRELLDSALLRPGRLEVQIEIPLPNSEGRREILKIHFDALRKRGRLSKPLCCAIDGLKCVDNDDGVKIMNSSTEKLRKREKIKRLIRNSLSSISERRYDLASDAMTEGFSGADLQGLVRCAGSIALGRARDNDYGVEDLQVTLEDVKKALKEIKIS
mmetsp:Transcript_29018/g.33343  ORF Transcript_29018/g.33343 Transcript_29018/m.33343 type:complete len:725 (+) Transcript_29018:186-2360(+)